MDKTSSKKQSNQEAAIRTIRKAAEKWPSSFLARSKVPEFSGGLFAVGTLANADSLGTGPTGAFRVGRQMCYPTDTLCEWIISKLEVTK